MEQEAEEVGHKEMPTAEAHQGQLSGAVGGLRWFCSTGGPQAVLGPLVMSPTK